jgi:hypothetical protein
MPDRVAIGEKQRKDPTLGKSQPPLKMKTAQDRYREPPPRRRIGDDPDAPTGDTIIPIPDDASGNMTVDATTGAVVMDDGDSTVIDFAGRKAMRDRDRGEPEWTSKFNANLADHPGIDLPTIASKLLEGIEADNQARGEWVEMGNRGAEYLGVKWEESAAEVSAEGFISKCHDPLMLMAVVKNWAKSIAELLPANGPVKVKDDKAAIARAKRQQDTSILGPQAPLQAGQMPPGGDPAQQPIPGQPKRSELADALEKDMNHYLTSVDKEYYPDTSRMLVMRALKGSQFKKVYYDPLLRRPVSRWVQGVNLIVSNDCSHLSGAGRVSEYAPTRQAVLRRLQRIGWWRDVSMVEPAPEATSSEETIAGIEGIRAIPQLPADYRHHIYECYCELDDGPLAYDERRYKPGFPLPYCVTLDKDSQTVLAIRRNWKQGDRDYRARRRYVHFGMVPGLGFYHWGFFHLLGNLNRASTSMLREFIDAEMFASFPGGVMRKTPGTRTQTTTIRAAPGQFAVVDTGGAPIDEAIKEWPYKGASQGLLAALQHVQSTGKELAGNLEMPVGEGRVGNVPVGTMMAYVDSTYQVPSAIHKGDHASQQEEFELLKECFEEDPDALVPEDDDRIWEAEMLADKKLVPAADPNVPSAVHRYMQIQALTEASGLPQFMMQGIPNMRAIWARICQTLGFSDDEELTSPPQQGQQPDPKAMEAMAKIKAQNDKTQLGMAQLQQKSQDTQREAANQSLEAEQREKDRESEREIALIKERTAATKDTQQHAREVGDTILAHHREVRGQDLDHLQHTRELAQQDRHHSAEQETARQGGVIKAASDMHATERQAETQRHATDTTAATSVHATETGARTAKETAAVKAKPKPAKPKGKPS